MDILKFFKNLFYTKRKPELKVEDLIKKRLEQLKNEKI